MTAKELPPYRCTCRGLSVFIEAIPDTDRSKIWRRK